MSEQHQQQAKDIVRTFRDSLSAEAQGCISDDQFSELTDLIRNTLTHELEQAAEQIEATARLIRAGIEKRQLEL